MGNITIQQNAYDFYSTLMVNTSQFTTKCKSDKVIALKQPKSK